MKIPDLAVVADAGVHDWAGPPEAVKSAAAAAKLKCCVVDLEGVGGKGPLMSALGKCLKLPEHFGENWDALADCLEDGEWLGNHGMAIVFKHATTYRKSYRVDWDTLTDILSEASEYWQERHKPFWVFVS